MYVFSAVSDAACEAEEGRKGLGLSLLLKLQRGVSFGAANLIRLTSLLCWRRLISTVLSRNDIGWRLFSVM